jgi:hypothetical protein
MRMRRPRFDFDRDLDRDERGSTSRGPEMEYFLRTARVGAVLLAAIVLGGIVVHAHRQANRRPPPSASAPVPAKPGNTSSTIELGLVDPADARDATARVETMGIAPFVPAPVAPSASHRPVAVDLPKDPIVVSMQDLGAQIQVLTTQFLKDTGATTSEELRVYTTGTEIYGFSSKFGAVRPFESAPEESDDEADDESAPPENTAAPASPSAPVPAR